MIKAKSLWLLATAAARKPVGACEAADRVQQQHGVFAALGDALRAFQGKLGKRDLLAR